MRATAIVPGPVMSYVLAPRSAAGTFVVGVVEFGGIANIAGSVRGAATVGLGASAGSFDPVNGDLWPCRQSLSGRTIRSRVEGGHDISQTTTPWLAGHWDDAPVRQDRAPEYAGQSALAAAEGDG